MTDDSEAPEKEESKFKWTDLFWKWPLGREGYLRSVVTVGIVYFLGWLVVENKAQEFMSWLLI